MSAHQVVCAIPARYASTRLPGKPLREIAGRPMIEHVYRRAAAARGVDRVVVLTDDARIERAVAAFGGEVEMTPTDCRSGTDRIAWAARGWDAFAVVNVQGDEPLLDAELVGRIARHLQTSGEGMVTAATRASEADLHDPDKVKVVLAGSGHALYFSRAPIPFPREPGHATVWRHLGIYGYSRDTLLQLARLAPTPLEETESLEQLRALENGIPIRVLEAESAPIGVDTEDDLQKVEALLANPSSRDPQRTQTRISTSKAAVPRE